ncbi:MAG: hypothetical protein ACEPOV_06590 [Hyphomicrobiales bacterium]
MNKKLYILSFLISLCLVGFAQKSEKVFTGELKYHISYPGSDLSDSELDLLPEEMKMYIGKDKVKTSLPSKMGSTEIIFDLDEKTSTVLVDLTGNKYAIKSPIKENKADTIPPHITETSDTKEIAGYNCKKIFLTVFDESGRPKPKITIYVTDEIYNPKAFQFMPEFKNLPGFPLEYDILNGEVPQRLTAIQVERKSVSKRTFKIPKGYKIHPVYEIQRNY